MHWKQFRQSGWLHRSTTQGDGLLHLCHELHPIIPSILETRIHDGKVGIKRCNFCSEMNPGKLGCFFFTQGTFTKLLQDSSSLDSPEPAVIYSLWWILSALIYQLLNNSDWNPYWFENPLCGVLYKVILDRCHIQRDRFSPFVTWCVIGFSDQKWLCLVWCQSAFAHDQYSVFSRVQNYWHPW